MYNDGRVRRAPSAAPRAHARAHAPRGSPASVRAAPHDARRSCTCASSAPHMDRAPVRAMTRGAARAAPSTRRIRDVRGGRSSCARGRRIDLAPLADLRILIARCRGRGARAVRGGSHPIRPRARSRARQHRPCARLLPDEKWPFKGSHPEASRGRVLGVLGALRWASRGPRFGPSFGPRRVRFGGRT